MRNGDHDNFLMQKDYDLIKKENSIDPLADKNYFTFGYLWVINLIIMPDDEASVFRLLDTQEKHYIAVYEEKNYTLYNFARNSVINRQFLFEKNKNSTETSSDTGLFKRISGTPFMYKGIKYGSFTEAETKVGINRNELSHMAIDTNQTDCVLLEVSEIFDAFTMVPDNIKQYIDPKTNLYINSNYATVSGTLYLFFHDPFSKKKIPFAGANACSSYIRN